MKNILLLAALVLIPSLAFSLTAEEKKLLGEWTAGGASYEFREDGTATVNSGVCSANIGWSVTDNRMSVRYLDDPVCQTVEPYQGTLITKTMPRPANETVRIELSSIETPGGISTKQLKVFGGNSPNGAVFIRTMFDMPDSKVQPAENDPKCKEFDIIKEIDRCKALYSDPEAQLQCNLRATMEMSRCFPD